MGTDRTSLTCLALASIRSYTLSRGHDALLPSFAPCCPAGALFVRVTAGATADALLELSTLMQPCSRPTELTELCSCIDDTGTPQINGLPVKLTPRAAGALPLSVCGAVVNTVVVDPEATPLHLDNITVRGVTVRRTGAHVLSPCMPAAWLLAVRVYTRHVPSIHAVLLGNINRS